MPDTAIVAGLGPGFCERFAERLAAEGYSLGLFGRSEEYLESYAADLNEGGYDALAVPTDVTDPDQVAAGFARVREALEDVRDSGGTVLFFGAAPETGDLAYRSGKDAVRGLARSLADTYGPEGVHVAHVVIAGGLRNPDVYEGPGDVDEEAYIDPEAAAETCLHLVRQDESARTFELDLRPHVEGLY